jgi:hypothetical protein
MPYKGLKLMSNAFINNLLQPAVLIWISSNIHTTARRFIPGTKLCPSSLHANALRQEETLFCAAKLSFT